MANRVIVIALSEASPHLIDLFCENGVMPRLRSLRAEGLIGRTRYGAPYLLTPQMWATILTGRNAGRHGIFDYWQRAPDGRFREVRGSEMHGPRLWNALHDLDIASGFVNVPMTYPPPQTKGFAISGQDAPGDHASITFPRSLRHEIELAFGRYHHKDIFPGAQSKEAYARTLPREVRRNGDVFEWLMRRSDWRFLILYSSGTAFAQHYFWEDMATRAGSTAGVVEETFSAADALIGRIADALDPTDTLFVMSECGAGPIASGVRLNKWLQEQGFLVRHRPDVGALAQLLALIRTLAPRYLPRWTFYFANRLPVKSWIQARIASDGINWSRTTAFHRGKGEGNIYLNVRGRDRYGILPEAEYEVVRSDIVARLCKLRDPKTGNPAVRAVHRREEIFAGDHVNEAPDLCVEWEGFKYMPAEEVETSGDVFGPIVPRVYELADQRQPPPRGIFNGARGQHPDRCARVSCRSARFRAHLD